jgi:aspartate aminotransferase
MDCLSDSLSFIKPSSTMAVTQRASELKAQGVDILSLSVGEPDFPTPEHIIEAAKEALDRGATRYTSPGGTSSLRRAVAEQSTRVRGVPCDSEQVIITVGAKHAIFEFFQAVLNPGDEVIIPAPYWVSYPDQVRLFDGVPIIAKTSQEDGFLMTVEEFQRLATPKTKVLVINTPNNPTGAVYPKDLLEALVEAATSQGILVLSDEVYRDLVYGPHPHVSPLSTARSELRDRVFVVDGVSKSHAMTGWRIGWGLGNKEIIGGMMKIQSQSTSNPAAVSQAAAECAVKGKEDHLKLWNKEYAKRRTVMCKGLAEIDGIVCPVPGGAFYVLPSVKGVLERMGPDATDVTLCTYLLEDARVAVVPGAAFGAPGHIRLAYAASIATIEDALFRMKSAIDQL